MANWTHGRIWVDKSNPEYWYFELIKCGDDFTRISKFFRKFPSINSGESFTVPIANHSFEDRLLNSSDIELIESDKLKCFVRNFAFCQSIDDDLYAEFKRLTKNY